MMEFPANIVGLPLDERAEMAMAAAFQKLVREHIRLGLPIAVWRDGKVVQISGEELKAYQTDTQR